MRKQRGPRRPLKGAQAIVVPKLFESPDISSEEEEEKEEEEQEVEISEEAEESIEEEEEESEESEDITVRSVDDQSINNMELGAADVVQ